MKDNKGLKKQVSKLKGQVNDLKKENNDYYVEVGELKRKELEVKDEMKTL